MWLPTNIPKPYFTKAEFLEHLRIGGFFAYRSNAKHKPRVRVPALRAPLEWSEKDMCWREAA